jgi:hypothetical protein
LLTAPSSAGELLRRPWRGLRTPTVLATGDDFLVQMAFEDRDGDGQWFLEGETGEVVRLNEADDDAVRRQAWILDHRDPVLVGNRPGTTEIATTTRELGASRADGDFIGSGNRDDL